MPLFDAVIFTLFVSKVEASSISAMDWSELIYWYDHCTAYADLKERAARATNG